MADDRTLHPAREGNPLDGSTLDESSVRPVRKRAGSAGPASQQLIAALTEHVSEWIAVLGPSGSFRLHGGAVQHMLGSAPAKLEGTFVDAVVEEDRPRVQQALVDVQSSPGARRLVQHRRHLADGQRAEVRTVLVNRRTDPLIQGVVATTGPITIPQSQRPPLSGPEPIEDRARFLSQVQDHLLGTGTPFTVLVIHVTNFHYVAAGLGRTEAEKLLPMLITRLRQGLRPGDSLATIGSNSIAILLSGMDQESAVQKSVERLRQRLRSPFLLAQQEVVVAVAMGFATSTRKYTAAEEALSDAEAAAQRPGGRRPRAFRTTMRTDYRRSIKLAAGLPHALRRNELALRFQPIVALSTGRIAGFEALCRWLHPELGLISPAEFIPLAEQLDWVVPLDRWMIEASCRALGAWTEDAGRPWLSVNISARHLDENELVTAVADALSGSAMPADRLHLEITETAIADSIQTSLEVMHRLRALGVRLAIDDFGTGYASLGQLSSMPLDLLKIDGTFVAKLDEEHGRSVVQGIIAMGHELGLKVVAERVETRAQLHTLRSFGCDYGQGYLFAKPLAGTDAVRLLSGAPTW